MKVILPSDPARSPARGAPPPEDPGRPLDPGSGDNRPLAVGPTTARPRSGLIRLAGPLVFAVSILKFPFMLW